eukprot:COSAG06_NODE_2513_length_6737_cov_2.945014_5_plen_145_part_00
MMHNPLAASYKTVPDIGMSIMSNVNVIHTYGRTILQTPFCLTSPHVHTSISHLTSHRSETQDGTESSCRHSIAAGSSASAFCALAYLALALPYLTCLKIIESEVRSGEHGNGLLHTTSSRVYHKHYRLPIEAHTHKALYRLPPL